MPIILKKRVIDGELKVEIVFSTENSFKEFVRWSNQEGVVLTRTAKEDEDLGNSPKHHQNTQTSKFKPDVKQSVMTPVMNATPQMSETPAAQVIEQAASTPTIDLSRFKTLDDLPPI